VSDATTPEEDQPVSTPEPETPAVDDEVVEVVEVAPDLDTDVEIEGLDAVAPVPAVFSDRPSDRRQAQETDRPRSPDARHRPVHAQRPHPGAVLQTSSTAHP
jgi:hypothetical protein